MITPEQLAKSGTEHGHQAALFCWASMNLDKYPQLKWMHSIPNGFHATPKSKATMKSEGLKAGVWDIFLPYPRVYQLPDKSIQVWCGLYTEMKSGNNNLTDEQKEFRVFASGNYKFQVCWTWEQARDGIIKYLEG